MYPIASSARVVRVVSVDRGTDLWRVECDGVALRLVQLSIQIRPGLDTYTILTPQIPPGWESPRVLGTGTFDRGSLWWTPEVLRRVLELIVQQRIAPGVVEIAIELPTETPDLRDASA